uniref:Sorting nexin 14 n=1 Tax=Nothobranchius furzeri TaxID=105023 RepID=A0A8C6M225_NOTFU
MAGVWTHLEVLRAALKIDTVRETGRQYPVSCCLLLGLASLTVLLNRTALLLENFQPWLDLKVRSKVDALVAEVFKLVLEKFVYPWYRDITEDEGCLDEVRMIFRFFASVLIRRAQKVDVPAVFMDQVMKTVMKHIEIMAKARVKVGNGESLEKAALEEYGSDLHVALQSRKDELLYLRKLTEMLFPFLLPPKATDCRSLALLLREVMAGSVVLPTMDFMADPDTVNLMVLIFVDQTPPEEATEAPSPLVPFLHRYADASARKPSVLKLELKDIREQQDLLFRFINFLKQEGAVHVLQFCLAAEEFNDKILSPELSDSELQRLHGEVVNIYHTYCLDESFDKIRFDSFITEDIRSIAEGPYSDVVKLQTMRCLFEAYEHVLSLLEKVFTPMFCHSDEYFRHLLRGAESPTRNSRISRNPSKRGETFGISRIGSRIKGVFKSQTMEGALLPPSATEDIHDDVVEEATMVLEDFCLTEPTSIPVHQRNLLAWSVSVPFIDFCEDVMKKEKIPVFCIQVERDDSKSSGHEVQSWNVDRRYLEFYVLESKLTEFHGTFTDVQLPSKRIIGPKNYEFLESKREEFEEYLQRLLKLPELRNSQLLADFLSPNSMESQFLDRMLPDVNNLGKIFKSVPGKLIKEKGQNLEPFIQSFFNSCESPRPKPNRPELTIVSPTAGNKKLINSLYRNNASRSDWLERKQNANYFTETMSVDGAYDYMMCVGRMVFHIPDWLHHILAAGRILLKNSLEAYVEQYMQSKLEAVLQEHRLVSLITQLRDSVFRESSEQRSAEDKLVRAKQTFEGMKNYLPDFVVKLIGEESVNEGVQLLFDGLQQPLLNKQLSYVLLDIAVLQLFPELNKQGGKETFIV